MEQKNRLQSLDSLRGIGALTVLIYHTTSAAFGGADGAGIFLIPRRGYLAVDLFFILSGFVLAYVYGPEFADGVRPSRLAAFLWARLARIYPVHLLSILLLLKLYGQSYEFSGRALALNLLLLQAPWLGYSTWNGPAWSISAEWHAYLLFPFLCAALARFPARAAVIVALACALALVMTGAENEWTIRHHAGPVVLARVLPEFILGILVYRAYRSGWLRPLWRSDGFFAAAVVAILALSAAWPTDLMIVVLLPGLLLAAATNEGRAHRLLISRPLTFLGDISYSLYMVHYVCLSFVFTMVGGVDAARGAIAPRMVAFFGTLAFSLVMASLVSRCIEYPARSFLRARWPKAAAPVPSPLAGE